MLEDFIEAKRGGICGILGDRLVKISEYYKNFWYIDANNLKGHAMTQ